MLTRAHIRLELLRIAMQQTRDDRTALTYAKEWEPWVVEALDQPEQEAKPEPKAAKPKVQP